MRRVIVLAVVAVLALPGLAFAAEPLPPGPGQPGPIASVDWQQLRRVHLQWATAAIDTATARPVRWGVVDGLVGYHATLRVPLCSNTAGAMTAEGRAAAALRLAAVRHREGSDRTARRYLRAAIAHAVSEQRSMPDRCRRP